MNLTFTSLLFAVLALASCTKGHITEKKESATASIINTWIYDTYDSESGTTTYKSAENLDNDKAGWIFKSNGGMIERAVSGFCGTPPVVYANYDNAWKKSGDNTIEVDGHFWGGESDYSIEIVSLTPGTLIVKLHY